eukprot:TRINITY_DN26740_c0_g1_i1.p1 TRINITY_DN26740_c0_g1~~TRINITY_DN26740_c0_g1_i1.p1  ORF type:complete len:706 (+),score=112.88 TRINITY_DN26740_c0_g1_i1:36-2120(+)
MESPLAARPSLDAPLPFSTASLRLQMRLLSLLLAGSLLPFASSDVALTGTSEGAVGYVRRGVETLEEAPKADVAFDLNRTARECFCGGSKHLGLWKRFHEELYRGLLADPDFTGDWVHSLCGMAYPLIFKIVTIEPSDNSFTLHSDCPAGLLSMVAVCAQSAALRQEAAAGSAKTLSAAAVSGPSDATSSAAAVVEIKAADGTQWFGTQRVVAVEGASVSDVFGSMTAEECLKHCQSNKRCRSFAHGPHGCHLKGRCVSNGEPLVPAGGQGEDYRTYYTSACKEDTVREFAEVAVAPDAAQTPAEEIQSMMSLAIRSLEFCFHCLDISPWPFLLAEVLENYGLSVEATADFLWRRSAGRHRGPSTRPGPEGGGTRATDDEAAEPPSLDPPKDGSALGGLSSTRLTLLRLQMRWTRGLESEASFWRKKLSFDEEENNSLERLVGWLEDGRVVWYYDNVCEWVADARARETTRRPPRVLNVGSGPFAPRPLDCELDSESGRAQTVVPVIAADGLARFYMRVFDENGFKPPYVPMQCPVEELHECFPPSHFDVVHMRNALDHAFDPLLGIESMLRVVSPGGWVLLRHARNEGVPGKFRNGLHQWAFDADKDSSGSWSFRIWNPELEVDVSAHLLRLGLAAEVRTELRDHPSPDAPPDEKYVWVEIRRPTRREAAARRAQVTATGLQEELGGRGSAVV